MCFCWSIYVGTLVSFSKKLTLILFADEPLLILHIISDVVWRLTWSQSEHRHLH